MRTIKTVSTKLEQIALNAKRLPNAAFSSLAYHIDMEWLRESFRLINKKGAVGVDGVTTEEYEKKLDVNLENLLTMAKSGRYKAPAVRRTYIPKPGSDEKRPLGIPTVEDKILQMAVKQLLTPIYEHDFYDCSYGFRPGHSQHHALDSIRNQLMNMNGARVIDLDIRKFFDTIKWSLLQDIVKQRVNDGVIIRLLGKWMNAGIMDGLEITYSDMGTPRGGVISPLLANIFLHEVLDKWLHETVFPRLKGKAFEVRYADDAIICFKYKKDAERVLEVLPKRLKKFGLTMHPIKTKLVKFRKPWFENEGLGWKDRPGTFTFLGFKHYWKKSRKGPLVIALKTDSKKFIESLRKVYLWCKRNRHEPLHIQARQLRAKLLGHYNYYGVRGNFRSLSNFYRQVLLGWKKWLTRRNRGRFISWEVMENKILARVPLPLPRIKRS